MAVLVVCAVVSPAIEIAAPDGSPLTDEQRGSLDNGEILVHLSEVADSAVKKATAIAVIDATPDQVIRVLTDYESFPEFMPYCKEVRIDFKDKDRTRARYELDFPWPIGDRHYVLELKSGSESRGDVTVFVNRWTYVPDSGNINDTYGSWEVFLEGPDRSLVRYTVFTDPGGRVPGWAANVATNVAVPGVIEGVRTRVAETLKEIEPASAASSREDDSAE
ncbi:MAG: hypothetical protein AMXMBFR82_21740 [Candidatus Hydrogenedentota bacterium]